jgi:hypothetical protein
VGREDAPLVGVRGEEAVFLAGGEGERRRGGGIGGVRWGDGGGGLVGCGGRRGGSRVGGGHIVRRKDYVWKYFRITRWSEMGYRYRVGD